MFPSCSGQAEHLHPIPTEVSGPISSLTTEGRYCCDCLQYVLETQTEPCEYLKSNYRSTDFKPGFMRKRANLQAHKV